MLYRVGRLGKTTFMGNIIITLQCKPVTCFPKWMIRGVVVGGG